MADASFTWTSFLGGEWSTYYQGRTEDPRYKTAMNLCLNAYPIEEGAWTRRPGFQSLAPTKNGSYARIHGYNFSETAPYTLEFTANVLRLYAGPNLVIDPSTLADIVSISTTNPVTVTVGPSANPFSSGVIELFLSSGPVTSFATLRNRQFTVVPVTTGVYALYDAVTGAAVDGTNVYWDGTLMTGQIGKVLELTTAYANSPTDLDNIRLIHYGSTAVVVNENVQPAALTLLTEDFGTGRFSTFNFNGITFSDGPYYDPVANQTASPSGTSGTVTFTLTGGFGPRNAATTADIGKPVRFFSEPLVFDGTHTYNTGDSVIGVIGQTNLYYTALQPSTGVDPSGYPAYWQLNPEAAQWAWGFITAVPAFNQIEVLMETDLLYANNVNSWRLGLWGGVDGWPKCGTFHGGRLWFGWQNRILASQPNDPYNMSPTEPDGTVTDASGINYTLQSGAQDMNNLNWMFSDLQGIVCGTLAGEWLIQASNLNDPLTATTADARKVTKYGCGFVEPVKTGLSLVFVQKYGHKLMEFLADVFTGKFVAPNLTTAAKHLTQNGIEEIVYCEELTPIIWMRDSTGLLRGITYRRSSAWSTEPPAFVGWHQHILGGNRGVYSICVTPSRAGTLDVLNALTRDAGGTYYVEQMAKMFDVSDSLTSAWHLDAANPPVALADTGAGGLTLYGYSYLAGETVSAWVGGLDCGDYVVTSNGTLTIPYGSDPDGTLTRAYLQALPSDTSASATGLYVTTDTTPARSPIGASVGSYASATDTNIFTDWALNRFVTYGSTNFTTYNIATRAQVSQAAITSVVPSATLWGGAIGSNSDFYIQSGLFSRPILYKINPATWAVVASFGDGTNDLISGPRGIQYSHAMATTYADGTNFVVSVNQQSSGLQVVNGDTMQWAAFQGTANIKSYIVRGFVGSVGTVFTLDQVTGTHGTSAVLRMLAIGGLAGVYSTSAAITTSTGAYDIGQQISANGKTYVSLTTNNTSTPNPTTSTANWGILIGAYNSGHTYGQYDCATEEGVVYYSVAGSNVGNDPKFNNDYEGTHDWTIVTNPYIKQTTIATLTPSQVDATWTHFFTDDLGFDREDGNLIVNFSTDDSVTNKYYIAKVNSTTGAIMWATPVHVSNSFGLTQARIQGGVLGYLADDGTTYSINTSTGASYIGSFPTTGLGLANVGQIMDSVTGALIGNFNYNSATMGAPTPLSGTPSTFGATWAIYLPGTAFSPNTQSASTNTIPALVGYTYASKGQLLRPGEAAQAGTQNGPPMGKTRRGHMYSALFANCITGTVTFGTDFTRGHVVKFTTTGGTAYNHSTFFNGVYWDVLDDGYSFDSMIAWQVTRPYPATICSVGGFLHTQDR